MKNQHLTTNQGAPITDNQNSLTVGRDGPTLLQDHIFLEKLAHFDRERIPERVVHAKGAGAHGFFKVYKDMSKYTMAKFLNNPTKETPVFVRFSVVIGSKGVADTVRDVRGFAVKFYTEDGNYDIVGNNLPIFFIRDAIKFPDLIHALKPDPISNIPGDSAKNNRFWDYISLTPEATHMITWLFSDLGTIKSYRTMKGAGVNTYKWINFEGESKLIKYHWIPMAGEKTIDRFEAEKLAGIDPDIASRDLFDTLAKGKTVDYELRVQMIDEDEDDLDFDPLDATKTWPEKKFPLMPVGMMTLNRNPQNFFAEVEQVAFAPSAIVPGIGFTNDKLLQGRLFSYTDTHMHRLGKNFLQLPINRPIVPINNNMQDGPAQYLPNKGTTNYNPNSLNNGNPHPVPFSGKPEKVKAEGTIKRREIEKTNDYEQAGERYRSLSKTQRDHLVSNIVDALGYAKKDIQYRMLNNFLKADQDFGRRVAKGLGLNH
ncbi:catalase [Oceanirhabdus seepicola]|uniref:Catalase n=1 Tax=Oceanirhabdus seepicola TaxID=2828781 RepID=A0A9J6P2E1_9CLOT|nr:catalase [Oceanirhabdus seepicola]MCM1990683.1 catalase [Oceanirhabdus seepicola]